MIMTSFHLVTGAYRHLDIQGLHTTVPLVGAGVGAGAGDEPEKQKQTPTILRLYIKSPFISNIDTEF